MSFDVFVQDLPSHALSVADIPDDFKPQPIGQRSDVMAGIIRAAPEADFSDPNWGVIVGDNYSIEINIGPEDPLKGFAFHIRGDQQALFIVGSILAELGLRAIAPGTDSGFFDLGELQVAYSQWQQYRKQIVGKKNA
jgi:hypothetical protein